MQSTLFRCIYAANAPGKLLRSFLNHIILTHSHPDHIGSLP
ncbi:MBL fold metallo-hydrolase [Paenibacillus zeirhizosphaerae]